MTRFLPNLAVLATAFAALAASPVSAQVSQAPSQRPYTGLFGRGAASSRQTLDITASAFGGWSDDVFSQGNSPSPTRPASGWFYGASVGLAYDRITDWGNVSAGLTTGLRFYPDQDDLVGQQHSGYFALSSALGARTTLSLTQAVSYSPRYRFAFVGDEALPVPPSQPITPPDFVTVVDDDYAVSSLEALSYAASAKLSQRVTKRGTLSGTAAYRMVDFVDEVGNDVWYWSASGRYSQQLSQHLGFHAGYGYRPARYKEAGQATYAAHNIDVGLDYDRAFTLSRSTIFTFSTGSAILVREQGDDGGNDVRYGLLASATLQHSFARTWEGTAAYTRGITYVPGLDEPFWGDTVRATLGGLISARLQFSATAGYSNGNPGFSAQDRNYDAYSATAGLRYALNRTLAVSTSYFFSHYAFDEGIQLPPGVEQEMDRQGVRASLDVFLPLLR